jgi:hypothetical protein
MTTFDSKKSIDSPVNKQGFVELASNEAAFCEWLKNSNRKGYSIARIIDSLSEANLRIQKRNFTDKSIWEINSPDEFFFIHKKALKDKIFCVITGHKKIPLFQLSGQLYFLFLKENTLTQKVSNQSEADDADNKAVIASVSDAHITTNRNLEYSFTFPGAVKTYAHKNIAEQNALRAGLQATDVYQVNEPATAFANIINTSNVKYSFTYPGTTKTYAHRSVAEQNALKAGLHVTDVYQVDEPATAFVGLSQTTNTVESNVIVSDAFAVNDAEVWPAIDLVLSEKFANGFAYVSPIQVGRLRRFVGEIVGKDIDMTDDAIIDYAKQSGTVFDNRVFVISADDKEQIKQIADEYFSCGAVAIFYEAFFEKHEQFLMGASIVSVDMLRRLFQKLYPNLHSNETYFGNTFENINIVITNEILRVWNDDSILTYSQIAERLPYIPYNRIKFVLSQNGDFIINRRGRGDNDGECIHISNVYISEAEKAQIRGLVATKCDAHRYISLADLDLDEIAEKNYGLSISALQTAVFQICCAGTRYERHGKIVTRRGEDIDALYIMKEFCKTQDKITLDDLLAYEAELTGEQHRWIPMQAGYDTMVRIDEQVYVADKHLDFDANAIDNAIEHFMNGGEYIPLQAVTTFALFPYCGQAWNLFLLESYCRRFSSNFRFETRAVNSKNTGTIIRKNSRLTYDGIMADYVARSNVALTKQAVLDYLFDNGLVSARKHKDIDNLIRMIKTIREGRS